MPKTVTGATPVVNQITSGYKLIDRYRLDQPFPTDLAQAETWHATDFALDRPVSVHFLSGPAAEAGAEAARRAALLSDSRLVKIIDVGQIENMGQDRHYIVTEPIAGLTLQELVTEMPLDAATTRSIIGELATALDEANQRGIHHVALRPAAVRINNGRVLLTGLGLDAELGAVNPDLGDSERQDAIGLAALAYYSLTGYWPLPQVGGEWRRPGVAPLPEAPRTASGAIVPLRELVPGADPVLLDLADRAFGEQGDTGQGLSPLRAPHAIAAALTPWHPLAVTSNSASSFEATLPQPLAAAPERHSVLNSQVAPRPKTGRIPKAGKRPIAVVPDDEPLHIRPVEVLDQIAPNPDAPIAVAQPATPVAPRPYGIRATPIVLGLMLLGVLGGGAWAAYNVINPFIHPETEHIIIEPDPPAYTAAPGFDGEGNPVETTPPAPVEIHPVVVGGAVVDPYGDGERDANAATVTDNDPSTFWYTYTYASPAFGGLKPGVGFMLTLEQEAPVNSVTLYANGGGGKFEVRRTTAEDPSGGQVLGTGSFDTETTVDFGGPIDMDSVMIWITELPQLPDGRYRLELREITLR